MLHEFHERDAEQQERLLRYLEEKKADAAAAESPKTSALLHVLSLNYGACLSWRQRTKLSSPTTTPPPASPTGGGLRFQSHRRPSRRCAPGHPCLRVSAI